ncbi:MAG: hypothetical protein HWD59_12720 [Coxiellaceae bacterium]|nr:MAG: hypothetical protein HWD59_12720 [Coxiellaceae bacterium]
MHLVLQEKNYSTAREHEKIETRYDSQEIINSFIEVFNSWKDFKAHYGSLPTFDLAKQAEEAREELERIQVIQDELLNVTQLLLEDILANIQILDDIAQNNVKKIQEKFQKLIKNTKEANIKDELFKLYSELNEISAPIEMAHIINQAITTTSPNTDGTSSSYYHNLTREESERVLKGKTPGCFLFRKSSQPNSISLSYMYADKTIRHALLQHSNGNFVYMDKSYSNLAEFLLAYKETLTTPLARISATSANNNNATKQSYQKPPAAPSMQTVELSVISSIEEVKRAQNTLKTQLDELSQLETNIKSLLKTKGNYSNFNEEERLKTELKKIQEQHAVLWGDYQAVQIKAQAIEAFKQYPNQWEYYHFFYIVFEEFLPVAKLRQAYY